MTPNLTIRTESYVNGWDAFMQRRPIDQNPHEGKGRDFANWYDWRAGWRDAELACARFNLV